TCQFISRDPVGADGEESAYQYCGGDPVGNTDPSGAFSIGDVFNFAKKAVAAVVKTVTRAARGIVRTVASTARSAVKAITKAAKSFATAVRRGGKVAAAVARRSAGTTVRVSRDVPDGPSWGGGWNPITVTAGTYSEASVLVAGSDSGPLQAYMSVDSSPTGVDQSVGTTSGVRSAYGTVLYQSGAGTSGLNVSSEVLAADPAGISAGHSVNLTSGDVATSLRVSSVLELAGPARGTRTGDYWEIEVDRYKMTGYAAATTLAAAGVGYALVVGGPYVVGGFVEVARRFGPTPSFEF
ncbi:MAG: hypothetical protein Q7W16_03120, partial [Coriobacteriia bacterium]|nr:hypothetical protein [Coriobacteriia bacterium]